MQFRALSPRFWAMRQLQLFTWAAAVAIALGVAGVLASGVAAATVGVLAVAVLAAALWMLERGRYRAWGYCERAEDLLVQRGLMFRRLCVVPYGRMQFIDVEAGPFERVFGLATVQLHTAAAATDARIPGLARTEAERLRDRLAELGEARATGL